MVSRRYISYKFRYHDDLGNEYLRLQRGYLENVTSKNLNIITPLFIDRIVTLKEKVNKSDSEMRHVLCIVNVADNPNSVTGEFKSYVPYSSSFNELFQHVKEIMENENFVCGWYVGESRGYKNG